ncbi:MAG: hypothetical protein ACHQF2_05865 [Flavobacteriales bacterium]
MIQNTHLFRKKSFQNRLAVLLTIAGLLGLKPANSQVSINISLQPLWGPVSYDYVEYYYLPEAEVYYYVPTNQFIYWNTGRWMYVSYLPAIYHIDLYRTYKVVLNTPRPFMHHKTYKTKYYKFKTTRSKLVIRDSKDKKYHVVKGHPGRTKAKPVTPNKVKPKTSKPGGTIHKNPTPSGTKHKNVKPNGGTNKNVKPQGTKSTGSKGNNSKGGGKKGK